MLLIGVLLIVSCFGFEEIKDTSVSNLLKIRNQLNTFHNLKLLL